MSKLGFGPPLPLRRRSYRKACIDGIQDFHLRGWAADKRDEINPLLLVVSIDNKPAGTTMANLDRPDLLSAGYKSAAHGFRFPISKSVFDGKFHLFSVAVDDHVLSESRIELPVLDYAHTGTSLPSAQKTEGASPEQTSVYYLLFDSEYYAVQTPAAPTLFHFQTEGHRSGLDPHPLFLTQYYREICDIPIDISPFTYFFTSPNSISKSPHPLFDAAYYRRHRPDVAEAGVNPLVHYLSHGWHEKTSVSDFFDIDYYDEQCPNLPMPHLVHYVRFGVKEGLRPHRLFQIRAFERTARLSGMTCSYIDFVKETISRKDTKPQNGGERPHISVIILNLNKSLLVLQCLFFLYRNTHVDFEVIIFDNGSSEDEFALLTKFAPWTKLIRSPHNLGFGEANNIAAEHARSSRLVFLNNDAFVTEGWLDPILQSLAEDDVAAVGPKFLYPDGRLQEAGVVLAADGTAVMRGRYLDGRYNGFDSERASTVDYCSAACLVVKTDCFKSVLGFDLCWDPAYYEDADLCLKLSVLGFKVIYQSSSTVVHVENGTSSDRQLDLRLENIVGINRLKFISRWAAYLSERITCKAPPELTSPKIIKGEWDCRSSKAVFSPYGIQPGGGERYILSLASVLSKKGTVDLILPEPCSQMRLRTVGRELNIDVENLRIKKKEEALLVERYDQFICMGNEILPSVQSMGKRSFYHCQFPFPLQPEQVTRNWGKLEHYEKIIVNSAFTQKHTLRALEELRIEKEVCIIHPPVDVRTSEVDLVRSRERRILSIGRFDPGGHCKRQDTMIRAFGQLAKSEDGWELHLAGALGSHPKHRAYLETLREMSDGLPVFFHVNVSRSHLAALCKTACLYWHLTGFGKKIEYEPELFEHFGIAIVEAMSCGAIPIAFGEAGPAEIIEHGKNGYLVQDIHNLIQLSAKVAADRSLQTALRQKAAGSAQRFDEDVFAEALCLALA